MSSYLSSLLTTTTSRYNSLRQTLLKDEVDGDTEDDSHISRVLRAYYTEKGRPFPPWLPPDPKAPQSAPTQFVTSSGRQQGPPAPGRGGGLSDLWDTPQQPQQQEPMSLRRAAPARGAGRGVPSRPGIFSSNSGEQAPQGQPLPSQRAGSYQSQFTQQQPSIRVTASPSPPPSSGSGTTAQERLKARLWGSGRSQSSASSAASTGGSQTPPAASPAPSQVGSRSPYETGSSYTSAGRSGPPYPDDRGGAQNPYASANSPWSSGGDGYAAGGGGQQGGGGAYDSRGYNAPGRERVGLPSGPRAKR